MKVRRESFPYLLLSGVPLCLGIIFQLWILSIVFGLIFVFVIFFFRDPERNFNGDDSILLSPADGKIIALKEDEDKYSISIFMSIFNCHVNRAPIEGEVVSRTHFTGNYISAFKEKASIENERVMWTIKGKSEVEFVQIAGLVARRIHLLKKKGDFVKRGERVGVIAFGSRVDVKLKKSEYDVLLKMNDVVKAGLTPMAKRKE